MTLDKSAYDVLNVVALKKMAQLSSISGPTGLDRDTVVSTVDILSEADLVATVGDAVMPTDGADAALVEAAARHYSGAREDPAVQEAADKFEPINKTFLDAMQAWQMVPMAGKKVANDHSDADYDAKVIDKLAKLVTRVDGVLSTLAEHDPRFTTYSSRFEAALEKVDRGERDYVSSPSIDSVHNIWFEFHEDLLRTLGRVREE